MLKEKKGPSAKRAGMSILMVLAMVVSGLAVLSTTSVVGQEALGGEYGGDFRVMLQAAPNTLNPLNDPINDAASQVIDLVYDSLGRIDPETLELIPWVASSWVVNQTDNTRVTVTLKNNVYWHDGTPVTLADIIYTFDTDGYAIPYIDTMTGDTENNAVLFVLNAPDARFFSEMMTMKLIPAGFTSTSDPMGCGPFSFESSDSSETKLVAFEDFFNERPYLDSITYNYDYSASTYNTTIEWAALELIKGRVDFIGWDLFSNDTTMNIEIGGNYTNLVQDKNITVEGGNGLDFWYMGLNNKPDHVLNNVALRKAIAHSIDKDGLTVYDVGGGLEKTSAVVSKYNTPWYNNSIEKYPFSPSTASSILDNAGFFDQDSDGWRDAPDGTPFNLTILGPAQEDVTPYTMSTDILLWLTDIGLDTHLVSNTTEIHETVILADNFDMFLWTEDRTSIDPQFLTTMYHSDNIAIDENILNFEANDTVVLESLIDKLDNVTLTANLAYTNLVSVEQVVLNGTSISDYTVNLATGLFTLGASVSIDFDSDPLYINYTYLPFDHLSGMAGKQMDSSMRAKYVKEAQSYLADQTPSIPLFASKVNHAFNKTIYEGWKETLGGVNNFWSFINLKNIITGELVITTFDAYPGYVTEGGSLNLAITIEDLDGKQVEDVTLALEGDGTFDLDSMTYADGRYTVPYTAPDTNTARTLTLKVTASKMAYDPDERETLLTVHPDLRSFDIDIDRGATSLDSDNSTDIIIIVTDKDSGQAVSDVNIVLTISPVGLGGYLTDYSGTTSAGSFSTVFGADNVTVDTTFRITVRVSKDGYMNGEQSTSISVSRDPDIETPGSGFLGLPAPSLIVVLMLVSGLALVYATGRRKRR